MDNKIENWEDVRKNIQFSILLSKKTYIIQYLLGTKIKYLVQANLFFVFLFCIALIIKNPSFFVFTSFILAIVSIFSLAGVLVTSGDVNYDKSFNKKQFETFSKRLNIKSLNYFQKNFFIFFNNYNDNICLQNVIEWFNEENKKLNLKNQMNEPISFMEGNFVIQSAVAKKEAKQLKSNNNFNLFKKSIL